MSLLRSVYAKCAFLIIFLVILSGCPSKQEIKEARKEPPEEGGYHYPLRYEVDTLDPVHTRSNSASIVINQLFDGLVQFDKDLNILPALAESWIISEDGRLYTFFLRKGVRFHNGRELKAEDVVYSLERILISKVSLQRKAFLKRGSFQIEEVKARDDYTLEIRLKKSYAPTLTILALTAARIVSRDEVKKRDFGRHPVGTGPFRFVNWKDREITLEANPDYFEGRPFLDKIVYKVFPGPDDKGIFSAFMAGDVENSLAFLPEDLDVLKSKGFRVIKRPIAKLHLYGFNNKKEPFNIREVRQAVYHAIDRERIIREAVNGRFPVANGLIPPGIFGYTPEVKTYPYDPERARGLLKEAGYPGGKGIPTIDFWTASTTDAARKELAIVKENLSDIGIRINIRYATWPGLEEHMKEGSTPIYRFSYNLESPDPEILFGTLLDSRGIYNYTFYNNPDVDRLIDEAGREMDVLKRVEIYREVEKMILNDAPFIPVLFYTYEQVLQPYVKGFEATALGEIYIPMKKVWFEKVIAKTIP